MTARHLLLTLATLLFTLALPAQNSKKVRALKAQQTKLQKQIKASQQDLAKTKKDVKQGQSHIHYLGIQLEDRLAHIRNMEADMDTVETQIAQLRQQITQLDSQLTDKKLKYTRALRIASQTPKVKTPIIFILSARNFTQMYRRARYTRQYAAYQYDMAQQIMQKQGELMETQNKYLEAKRRMVTLVREVMYQRKQLNEQPDMVFAATEGCDYIILAGFLPKVPEYLIERFPNRIINIHPALLPKFGGKGMWGHHVHEAVKAAGETESGITIHYVNAELDQGEHIAQYSTPLSPSDTAEDIADKVHELEMRYFPGVIEQVIMGNE